MFRDNGIICGEFNYNVIELLFMLPWIPGAPQTPLWDVQDTCVNHSCSPVGFYCFVVFSFLSKRQVWSRSMSVVWPFITAAMKARLMDMKAQSIGQEREIREGWVTIFLLLDNHVMPCSLSRDIADWCLSFISTSFNLTFHVLYNHISWKSISHQPLFPCSTTCGPEHSFAFIKKDKENWQSWQ